MATKGRLDLDAQFEGIEPIEYLGVQLPGRPHPIVEGSWPDTSEMPTSEDYLLARLRGEFAVAVGDLTSGESLPVIVPPEKEQQRRRELGEFPPDLAIPTHKYARGDQSVVEALALGLIERFENNPLVDSVQVSGMFANVVFDATPFSSEVLREVERHGDMYGQNSNGAEATAIFDNSAPNVAKFMSVAHLRSTVIGESLARIYAANGYSVVRDNHLGDWGSQFGILGSAVELWGSEFPDLQSDDNNRKVRALFELYVRVNKEIASYNAPESTDIIDEDIDWEDGKSPLTIAGREWFKRLEEGDEDALSMWRWSRDASLVEFQKVYELLGVEFEQWLGESVYAPYLDGVVDAFVDRGVAVKDHEGTIRLGAYDQAEDERNKPEAIQKSDGTSLYATRDLATLLTRNAWFDDVAKIIYAVDQRQGSYFQSVFDAYRNFVGDRDDAAEMVHAEFGLMKLPTGKMSTREGNVIFLEDVLEQAIGAARQKLIDSDKLPAHADVDLIARQIGAGALTYFDLMGPRTRGINFNMDDALNFEHNSGPYLQYQSARMASILRTAEKEGFVVDPDQEMHELSEKERRIVDLLAQYPQVVVDAADRYEPSKVSEYLYRLAKQFSSFYAETRIFEDGRDGASLNGMLRITQASRQVMGNGLGLLNIQIPEYM